jgi:fructose-1-phosphate kinase PfkB-like protein
MMTINLDLITVGRISVDLFAEQINTSFTQPQTFHKSIGGSPTNVAVAAARLGHTSAIITKVGVDPLGQYVVKKLQEFGVNTDFVKVAEGFGVKGRRVIKKSELREAIQEMLDHDGPYLLDVIVPYIIMIIVLMVRPYGLFGTKEVVRV